jgi:hypothetical protein
MGGAQEQDAWNPANTGAPGKKTQPIRVGISNYGGVGGNRTRVRKHSTTSSTYLV